MFAVDVKQQYNNNNPLSWRKIPYLYEVSQLVVTNETSYDFIVLKKNTGVVQGLLIGGDQLKQRKNWTNWIDQ